MGLVTEDTTKNLVISVSEDDDGDPALYYGDVRVAWWSPDGILHKMHLDVDQQNALKAADVPVVKKTRNEPYMVIDVQ